MNKLNESRFIFIELIGLAIFIITAYFSIGYYHGDEHYQIIEFAGVKLGTHQPNELAWEFSAKIRSAFQPTVAYCFIYLLNMAKLDDPYSQMFVIRLFTALFSFSAITFFIGKTDHYFENKLIKRIYRLLSYLLWFIPFLSVRYSSETWSGILFMIALGLLLYPVKNKRTFYLIGFWFGLSFLCRFQMGIALASAIFWMKLFEKSSWSAIFQILISSFLILVLGVILDSWFYGELTLSWLSYFEANILDGVSKQFGTSVWEFYFIQLFNYPTKLVGAAIIISLFLVAFRKPKSPLLWIIISFLLVHSFIPHKEQRFIFPLAFLFPLVVTFGINYTYYALKNWKYSNQLFSISLILFLFLNTVALFALSLKPAGLGRMAISKYLHENYGDRPINLIYCDWASPYDPWHGLTSKFYSEQDYRGIRITSICELSDSLIEKNRISFLSIRKVDLNQLDCTKKIESLGFKKVKESIPAWVAKLNEYYEGFENRRIFLLYRKVN